MNSSSNARPVITSGMTSGAVVMPTIRVRPRKGPKRARATPGKRAQYHRAAGGDERNPDRQPGRGDDFIVAQQFGIPLKVGECAASQTVTRRELLSENTIIDRIGAYRNVSPTPSMVRANAPEVFIGDLASGDRRSAGTA